MDAPKLRVEIARRTIVARVLIGLLATGSGALLVQALPPSSLWWAAGLSLSALYVLLDGRTVRGAFGIGYPFGLGFFGFGTSWIGESFSVDAERFGALAIPAVAALSAFLALFTAATCAVFALLRPRHDRFLQAAIFALCWGAFEWVRGHILTGFPWNLTAYATADLPAFRQVVALVGSYGLSIIVVWLAILPALAVISRDVRTAAAAVAVTVLASAAAWTWGSSYIDAPTAQKYSPIIRIVQGNIAQSAKWDPAHRAAIIERYLELSASPGRFDVLVWPETAYPGFLAESDEVRARLASLLPEGGYLLAGSPTRHATDEGVVYHNAILAMRSDGSIADLYAKHHLVPFGEYVPFKEWLPFQRMVEALGDFTPGTGPKTLDLRSVPKPAASICYEAIFPGHVVARGTDAAWIVNVTNDAWFGASIGPHQHLAAARMRAVEEGLPLIRAANTGISVATDAHGRSLARLGLLQQGIVDVALPAAHAPTPYARFGDALVLALGAFLLMLSAAVDRLLRRVCRRAPRTVAP